MMKIFAAIATVIMIRSDYTDLNDPRKALYGGLAHGEHYVALTPIRLACTGPYRVLSGFIGVLFLMLSQHPTIRSQHIYSTLNWRSLIVI